MDLLRKARKAAAAAGMSVGGGGKDLKYFTSTKKGEVSEFKAELHATEHEVVKDAVKKVIAALTVGKDMSPLFPDVINCMQTEDMELKKLVYLYLMNYAKSNPDLAIMAVNTFVKDTAHSSPLIRALAVRTMGCIRVDKITEYLCDPLKRALADEDPYVKKTAAVCVAKLFDISPELVREQGFIDTLRDLISDANPSVVANAVAALSEIQETSGRDVFDITAAVLQKLLAALNECTEWGQVFILDALAKYTPTDAREAESIIERVLPRLNHQNSAVVLSAAKIIMQFMEIITNVETLNGFCRKLAPSLVTLSQSRQPEIQYVALRNISLVVQKRPNLLAQKIKVFFCKYNDPIYVKKEKLEILVKLESDRNIDQVLLELKEYASEVDVDFVRKSVRTIGRCAIKLERAAERCIKVLLDLIQTKVNYVVQEAVVVIKDIFRRYPNRYESVIGVLCDALDTLDEPEAKASMIWIIGEYAARIENADELLTSFLETFHDETAQVQLQLLTATVKLFLRKPDANEALVQRVLNMATVESDNPDLRDRGYIYWRLLCADADAAKAIVLADKPVISDDTNAIDPGLLEVLLANVSTLAAVFHKPPEAFVSRVKVAAGADGDESGEEFASDSDDEDKKAEPASGATAAAGGAPVPAPAPAASSLIDVDLLGLDPTPAPAPAVAAAAPTRAAAPSSSPLDFFGAPVAAAPSSPPLEVLGSKDGITIRGALTRVGGKAVLQTVLENGTGGVVGQCALRFKPNKLGVAPDNGVISYPNVAPGSSAAVAIPLSCVASQGSADPLDKLVGAMRDNASGTVVFFDVPMRLEVFLREGGPMDKAAFVAAYRALPPTAELSATVKGLASASYEDAITKLAAKNVYYIDKRVAGEDQTDVFFSASIENGTDVLIHTTWKAGFPACKLAVRVANPDYAQHAWNAVERALKA